MKQNNLAIIVSSFDGLIFLTGDANIHLKENSETPKRFKEVLNNQDFEQHVGQPAKEAKERIDISSIVPSRSFILMLFYVPQKVTRLPSILLQRFLQMIFSNDLNVLELK